MGLKAGPSITTTLAANAPTAASAFRTTDYDDSASEHADTTDSDSEHAGTTDSDDSDSEPAVTTLISASPPLPKRALPGGGDIGVGSNSEKEAISAGPSIASVAASNFTDDSVSRTIIDVSASPGADPTGGQ